MATKKMVPGRRYEVLVSFSGLDKGEQFTLDEGDLWAAPHVQSGYLRDVTTEEVPDVGRGEVDQG